MAQAWTDKELRAIVKDHFDMLEQEQRGVRYNKTAHRRALKGVVDRTDRSIEAKHMNISAVLETLGLPRIDGYQPYRNYQNALFETVTNYLHENRELYKFLSGEGEPGRHDSDTRGGGVQLVYDDEPPPRSFQDESPPKDMPRATRSGEDPGERDFRNRALGKEGEELVFESEKRRLRCLGREDLARKVRWVAKDEGDGLGYDILSFKGCGEDAEEKRLLEVKTTNGPRTTPFYLTRNELDVSKKCPKRFRIVRVYGIRTCPRAYRLKPPLDDHLRLTPTIYRASL